MILYNPTDQEVAISFKGDEFVIEALGELKVSNEVGTYWQGKIHAFLEIRPDRVVPKVAVSSVATPVMPEPEAPKAAPKAVKTTK